MCVCAPAGPSCEGIGVTGHGALHPEGVPGQTGTGVEVWRGIPFGRHGIRISMPKLIWHGNFAWDPLLEAWELDSHAKSHAKAILARELSLGVGFGVGIVILAWDLAWDLLSLAWNF